MIYHYVEGLILYFSNNQCFTCVWKWYWSVLKCFWHIKIRLLLNRSLRFASIIRYLVTTATSSSLQLDSKSESLDGTLSMLMPFYLDLNRTWQPLIEKLIPDTAYIKNNSLQKYVLRPICLKKKKKIHVQCTIFNFRCT